MAPSDQVVTVQVEIKNLTQLRWLMDQWAIERGLAESCEICGWGVFPGRVHTCPQVVAGSASDLPAGDQP